MILPDVNVLLYAFRRDSGEHAAYKKWLETVVVTFATALLEQAAKVSGNPAHDAWFAALAIESGCEWITTGRDFTRFAGLRSRAPL